MTAAADRHLSADSFADYLRRPAPHDHPIFGEPRLILFIDPPNGRIGLRGPAAHNETPHPTGLEHVSVRAVHHDQLRMIEISVNDSRVFEDAYPVLRGVADRVQLDGRTMTDALTQTLRRLGHLLRPEETLSRQVETGLLGELCLFAGFAPSVGTVTTLAAWRGGQAEEHDYGFADLDIEVKTTTSERRAHWISALSQLVPTGSRPLWLVSFQITKAGAGGRTLAELIAHIRGLCTGDADRRTLDDLLHAAGWRERYITTCDQRWRLRTPPAVYAVTAGFPRLTPDMLQAAGVDEAHVTDVTYRLELTGRPADPPPAPLADAVTTGSQELA
jgi:hypothetical protein